MNKLTISIILFLFVAAIQAKADTWENTATKFYYSENKTFMLKIVPTSYPENYWKLNSRRLKKKKRISEKDTTILFCTGTLYKISATDTTAIWERKLINRICPVSAIVSNDGSSVVTFDNWLSLGYGVDTVVVYNELGDLKRRFQLEDISPFPINDYLRSISSLYWNCGKHYIDNNRIEICFCNEKEVKINRIFNVKKLVFEK